MSHPWLEKIKVVNFRNISSDVITFGNGINCIFGDNGNGKTNILEAINFLIHKKSFRKNTAFPQILSIDCEESEIIFSSVLVIDGERKTLSAKISSDSSSWFYNQEPLRGKNPVSCIFINPFDSYHFFNSSTFRRKWFDEHISLWDVDYKKKLRDYHQSLKFRNTLLAKKPSYFLDQIFAIDENLANVSKLIIEKRCIFLNEISDFYKKTFKAIFSEENDLEIQYESKMIGLTDLEIKNILKKNIEKDKILGHTAYGIHKDDYTPYFNGLRSFDYCSLGQQKMSYLSLIFAYIELLRYKYRVYPVVLIDDVSGELDKERWGNLINYLKICKYQVLITTANESFQKELEKINGATKILVANGRILKN